MSNNDGARESPEKHRNKPGKRKLVFCLYVSGATLKSTHAVINVKPAVDGMFKGEYDLRVVDV